jgi:O-antigen/teichoic acid export membrane protein
VTPIATDSITRRLSVWAPRLASFFWLQAAAQALALAAGLITVRALSVADFALLTIALAVQTTMVILADSGITPALLARAGAVATDRRRFSEAVRTAVALRRRFQAAALAVGVPVLVVLLRWYGVSWTACVLAGCALAVSLHGNVQQTLYATVLYLQLRPADAQRAAVVSAAARLVIVGTAGLLFPHWIVFLGISAAAILAQGALTQRRARIHLEEAAGVSAEDREAMMLAFKNQVLNGIYFAFQPQITVWILTVFGTASTVADVGALTRLTIAFGLVSAAFGGLALPRFARYREPVVVRRRYALLTLAMAVVGAAATGVAWLLPGPILSVLGPSYRHLSSELLWLTAASAVSLVSAAVHQLNTARGWVRGIWLGVPATILMQILLAWFVDLSTVRGAILIQASAFAAPLLINVTIGLRGMRAMTVASAPHGEPSRE